jgi:hypothetical protein
MTIAAAAESKQSHVQITVQVTIQMTIAAAAELEFPKFSTKLNIPDF